MTERIDWQWTPWAGLDRDALYALARLRQDVFIVEQHCAYADLDGRDPGAHHLLGWNQSGLIAYLRAFGPGADGSDAVLGRVIVAPSARHLGLGHTLMEKGRHHLDTTYGFGPIRVGAQAHLQRFYESLGYSVCGPGYDEDGIPHLPMRRP